jgi:CubicO group peptidase (beta-lactamase class C family)
MENPDATTRNPTQIRSPNWRRVILVLLLLSVPGVVMAAHTKSRMESRMDELFQDYNKPGVPGASVIVVRKGKVVFAKGYGLADVEGHVPCATNTNFRLASVTKQFTAMAVMILAERKRLSLNETLADFFPEFPAYGRTITVRQLLTHTSGLIDYEDVIPKGTTIPVLDRDVLRLLLQQDKTYFPPGTKFRYSNSAYALLALIVEARSGQMFARFLKLNIFEPLKMENTLAYEQGMSLIPNRAFGYTAEGSAFQRTDQSLTSSVLGDGGIYSSVVDLRKWDAGLRAGKLVKKKTLEQIFAPGPESDHPGTRYGFGWYTGEYRGAGEIWHSGTTRGFSTRIVRYPDKGSAVIILTNRNEAQLSDLAHAIADAWFFN